MHELSIAQAIVDVASRHAGGSRVTSVRDRIGHLRQVVPDALAFCWTMLTEGTDLEQCTLEIEQVPAVLRCRSCEAESVLDVPLMLCPSCSSDDVTLLSGEEFLVVAVDLVEA